jgi:hypothetical protein
MAIVGRAIRQAAAHERAAAQPCPQCGHGVGEHREAPRDLAETMRIENGALVTDPNPAYRPLHFPCSHEGCSCVLDLTGA